MLVAIQADGPNAYPGAHVCVAQLLLMTVLTFHMAHLWNRSRNGAATPGTALGFGVFLFCAGSSHRAKQRQAHISKMGVSKNNGTTGVVYAIFRYKGNS